MELGHIASMVFLAVFFIGVLVVMTVVGEKERKIKKILKRLQIEYADLDEDGVYGKILDEQNESEPNQKLIAAMELLIAEKREARISKESAINSKQDETGYKILGGIFIACIIISLVSATLFAFTFMFPGMQFSWVASIIISVVLYIVIEITLYMRSLTGR